MEKQELYIYTRYRKQANVEWVDATGEESLTAFYEANEYLLANLQNLRICPKCFQLCGLVTLKDGQVVEQKCGCHYPLKEDKWQIKLPSGNYYNDFNEEYEICYCCGLEVIPSGSRWSLFYCVDCKGKILEFNDAVRQYVIPLGRHSMMNRILLDNKDIANESAIAKFADSVKAMARGIDLVKQHRKAIVKKRVALLQLTDDAPVIDLLLKSNGLELQQMKTEAFFELLATRTNLPIHKVKSLYEELMG